MAALSSSSTVDVTAARRMSGSVPAQARRPSMNIRLSSIAAMSIRSFILYSSPSTSGAEEHSPGVHTMADRARFTGRAGFYQAIPLRLPRDDQGLQQPLATLTIAGDHDVGGAS